jgi:predicted ATPase/DNA-binding XRE family transcriptional regulator
MNTSDAKATSFSSAEENFPLSWSEWLKCRRQELDLTQEQLAQRASCSVFAIRKMESGERRPSRQLAKMLAQSLEIPCEEQAVFIRVARGELGLERLSFPAQAPSAGSGAIPGNLPRALTPFIGRESELSTLGRLLCDPQCSLLTLVGSGGIGKTRLAVEAASQSQEHFPDGVWFVPLAALSSPALLIPAIANVVKLRFQDPADSQTQLLRYLCKKKALLVLDNAEHLLEGVGLFVEILQACPDVKLLVTSRERLNLLSEWVFEITGLPGPPDDHVESFEAYSSVALFLQCAQRVYPGFVLDRTNRTEVAKICRLVGGMPLAIELAAAWTHLLPCTQIAQEIERDIDFLADAGRGTPPRHTSMRAVFDHSWGLLTPHEQAVLRKLSVFRGSFGLAAAQAVAEANLAHLRLLLDKSLIRRNASDRYDLHELTRQYAYEQLVKAGEEKGVRDQALRHYLSFAELRLPEVQGKEPHVLLRCLEEEMGNLRAALEWAHASGQIEERMRLAWALFDLGLLYDTHAGETRHWMEALLAEAEKTPDLPVRLIGNLLYATGVIARLQLDLLPAEVFLNRSLELHRSISNQSGQAAVLNTLGIIASDRRDFNQAKCLFEASLAIKRELGENTAQQLNNLGMVAAYQGDYQEALDYLEESLQLAREGRLRGLVAVSLGSLGEVEFLLGDRQKARAHFLESLQIHQEVDDKEMIACALENLAACNVEDEPYLAARLFGAADALRKLIGIPVPPMEAKRSQHFTELARTALGEASFRLAWQEGEAKPLETLIQEILRRGIA